TFVDWDDVPRWSLIDKALDVGFPEPVETYSTSPHLYTDLGIPEGTKGRLPKSAQHLAGLDAEELEALGETGKRPGGSRSGRSGRSGGQRSGGRQGGSRPARGEGSSARRDAGPADSSAGTERTASGEGDGGQRRRRNRTRRRTRGGQPATDAGSTSGRASGATD